MARPEMIQKEKKIEKKLEKKGKSEKKSFFADNENGCKKGQQYTRYARMLKPEEKRCYVCGKHKAYGW